ncbi:MAG: DNA-directed RNA polymerase subunit alpha [Aquificota bacterium]|nr:DNA-directed RNA polymerase subunit alpha [Aquificota bacterium]
MLNEFVYPSKVYWEVKERDRGVFVCEPLERGYGTTIGNALRRVLLSSISGTAVTAVKIYGVYHEFSALDGIAEDVVEIIANIKGIRFNLKDSDVEVLYLKKKGEGEVRAGDINLPPNVEIANPDRLICTITDPKTEFNAEIKIERGKGYVLAEEMEAIGETGWILVDADFSPVKLVSYRIEPTRVGEKTDYEKLIMEIKTDGTKTPEEAVKEAVGILKKHLSLLEHISYEVPTLEEPVPIDELSEKLTLSIEELDISQRALNSLKRMGITTIGDLVQMTEEELKSTKNIGRKALAEIKEALKQMGLQLGLNIESKR